MCERLEKWISTLVGVGKKNTWLRYPIVLLLVVMTGLYAVCDWISTTVMPRAKGVATMIKTTGGRTTALVHRAVELLDKSKAWLVDKVQDIKKRKNKTSMEDKVKAFTHPRMRRRVLTVALSFCVVLTTMPVAAFGTEPLENTGEGGPCTCTAPVINEDFSDKTVEAEAFPYALDFDAAGNKMGGECTVEGHQNTDVTYTYSFVSATGENAATVAPKENDATKTTLTFPVADAYTMKCVAEANGMTTEKEAVFTITEKALVANTLTVDKGATTVTTWSQLTAAIGNAPSNGTETVINISGTIPATSITDPINILTGKNIVINGGTIKTTKKLFWIISGGKLTLNGLHLDGGNVKSETQNIVDNVGTLIINDGCVFENFAFTGDIAYQSIIVNKECLRVNRGVFRNNTSSNTQKFSGVAIYNSKEVYIAGGTFSNNTHAGSGYGAALYNSSNAKCYISGGTFESNNKADSNKAGIFHSAQSEQALGEMHLSGNPAINCPLFLDAGDAEKFIFLDGGLTVNVTLKPAQYKEDYVLVKANESYTLTNEDYLRINLLQPKDGTQWYTKLTDDGKSIVATQEKGDRLDTVYLSLENGNDTADGSTKDTAVKTFDRAKQILAQGGKIVLIPPATISGNQLWELPENVFGSAAAVTDEAGNSTITVTGTLDLGDIKIEGIDKIVVEPGGSVSIGNNTTVTGGTDGGTTDIVVKSGGTLDVGGTTNLDGIGTIYAPDGATVNDNGNTNVAGNTQNTLPALTHQHPVCGGNTCAGDHGSHDADVDYVALDDGNGKIKSDNLENNSVDQLKAGHYYLTSDVTYDGSSLRILSGINADICLNGHKLILSSTYGNLYMAGGTVNICDCKSGGEIVSQNSSAVFLSDNSTANLYNIIANGNHADGSVKNAGGTLNIFGGTVTNSNATGYDVYNIKTFKMAGNVSLSKGIHLSENKTITLNGKMTNTTAIPINLEKWIDGATVIQSDGTYTITKEDMAKFTLKNSGYSLQLQGEGTAAKVVVKTQEQTKKPFYGSTSGWAFSEAKALIRRVNDVYYIDDVTFKLYDAKAGGNEIVGRIEKIDSRAFYVTGVTEEKEYFVSAQEKGKSESERVSVTVYPQGETNFEEEVCFNTPKELSDYLNIMKPSSATESDSKVSLSKDITVKQDMRFIKGFNGVLDLGGKTLTHDSITREGAIFTEAKSLTLQNGTIETKSEYGIGSHLGKTVLNKITVKGVVIAVNVQNGNLEVTDSNLMIVASGDSVDPEEFTATLVALESDVAIQDGTLSNEVTSTGTANYTYVGDKALSKIIADGSITTQTSETIISGGYYQGRQGCKDKIVITKGEAPSTQSKLDQIFGAGNTTFVAPNSININKDIELDDTATITKDLLGKADITINLNGNKIKVKPATGAGKDAIVAGADVNLTIKGPGSIAGGNGTNNGNGGDAVSGGGSVTINGGATITGGNGAGTGNGGNGIDITGSGNVTIDKGTVTGGTGATGGNGVVTDSGNITINKDGSANGGDGINGSGSTAGGTGGIGTVTGNTGNTTINGSVTGGNGGNGAASGSGNGGNGGSGVTEDGTIGGSGTITGGNGGNIPEGGSGTPGSGGDPITGGGSFPSGTTTGGQAGANANAQVDVKPGAPEVTVPEHELIAGAATSGELADNAITHIEVTLTVEKKENPADKDKVEAIIAKGQEIGVYLDIALIKEISKGLDKETKQVTEAEKPITITVAIPENMRKGSEYKIIRVHNGAAETITPVHDATKHTLTFTTDKFSTYAIAYTPEGGSSGGGTTVIPPVVEDDDHINTPTTGEIEADVTVDDTGKATATVDDKAVSDTIKKAEEEAKKNGNLDDGITLVIHVNTKDKGAKYIAFNLSKATQEMILQKKIIKTLIVVDNPKAKITLDLATVKEMNRQANGDILISATLTSGNKLSAAAKKAIGTRPAFDLKATYSGGTITDLGKGKISVEIPYTLRKGETASGLMAVSVDDKGKVSYKTNSSYKAKKMIFSIRSMGVYGIGHKKAKTFTDTKKHWAKEDISFVVSRGLISGTSKTKFSPNTAMNRADLVTALGKIAGVKASDYKESSFTDVKDSAAYMPYVEWAVKNEIIKDMGNGKFSPKGKITREEMALILQNFAKVMDVELPKVHEKNTFADNSKISPWAKDAVKAMQMAGIIMGEKNNRFDPKGSVTRAQVSATIKRFIELMIDRDTASGWQQNHSGGWMYFEAGKAVKSRTKKIAGKKYTFDRYGVTTGYPPVNKPVVQTRTYKAKRGDSFWSIAKRFKVSMYNLAKINGKTIHSVIHPGDVLKIPN